MSLLEWIIFSVLLLCYSIRLHKVVVWRFMEQMDFHSLEKGLLPGYNEPVLDLDSEEEGEPASTKPILVGKFVSETRRFTLRVVGDVFPRAWSLTKPIEVIEVRDNVFLFVFNSEVDKASVLSRASWNISVTGLPPHYMRFSKAQKLLALFPDIIEYELPPENSILWGDFYRVKALIDVNQPIPTGFVTKDRLEDKAIIVSFQYEDIGNFFITVVLLVILRRICSTCIEDKKAFRHARHPAGYGPGLRMIKSYGRRGPYKFPKVRDGTTAARVASSSGLTRQAAADLVQNCTNLNS
ncbi:hypothetical protein Tsubulata_050714 [Turnera subulata]|uniref:DUF4283 domain-containing protein n=1 Tax=Turnera subulata TaxID=218843 RepID=A0A9Q0JD90_9ROSI|nr:hypothetical protein Tsubulata_050714 [Turnera subulata]